MKDKKLDELVEKLERAFQNFQMWFDGKEEGMEYFPEYEIGWYEFLEILDKNDLEIKHKTK